MQFALPLIFLILFSTISLSDDIDDSTLASQTRFQPFDLPKIVTLFTSPQSITPAGSNSLPILEDKCKPIFPDNLSPYVFIMPPSDQSKLASSTSTSSSSKSTMTATLSSAFQMEAFLQSLASLLGNSKTTSSSTSSKSILKPTSSIIHVTSTILLTSHGCIYPTPTPAPMTQYSPSTISSICPIQSVVLSPPLMSTSMINASSIITHDQNLNIFNATNYQSLSHTAKSISSPITVTISPSCSTSTPSSNSFSSFLMPNSNIINTDQDFCLMISIPDTNGHNMIIQVPRPNKCKP